MLKFLILCGATLLCFQIAFIDTTKSSESSEEIQSGQRQPSSLPGVGVIAQPILQAVTVHQPQSRNDLVISRLLSELVAQRDVNRRNSRNDKSKERVSDEDDDDDRDSKEKRKNDDDRDSDEIVSRERKVTRDIKTSSTSPICILLGGYGPRAL